MLDAYTSTATPLPPPEGLSPRGRQFWIETLARVELRQPDEVTILHELCRTLGMIDVLAGELAGATSLEQCGSQGQPVGHWAIPELRVQRGLLVSLTKALRLPDEEPAMSDDEQARDAAARSRSARKAARARWDNQRSG